MITRPTSKNGWIDEYLTLVPEQELLAGFKDQTPRSLELFHSLSEEQLLFRYDEGKWNIKEIIVHIMDTERVFCYRALRFARNDKTELAGFDHDIFTENSLATERSLGSMLEEYAVVRTATVAMFNNFDPSVLTNRGVVGGTEMAVDAIGYFILGHERRHVNVILERYLKK